MGAGGYLILGPFSRDYGIYIYIYIYVTGSEKRGHFVQNVNFYHFSNCHYVKGFRALGFPLALQTL